MKILILLAVICYVGASTTGPMDFRCADVINRQIANELKASQIYLNWSYFFGRHDVALPGFQGMFSKHSDEEREHAKMLMEYLNKRGGTMGVTLTTNFKQFELTPANAAEEALTKALALEKEVTESLKRVHECGEANNDANLQDFIESNYLQEQVDGIKTLSDQITKLRRSGTTGMGLYLFEKEL